MFEFRSFCHVCLAVLKCYICVFVYQNYDIKVIVSPFYSLGKTPICSLYVYTFWKYNDGQNKLVLAAPLRRQWHPTPVILPGKSHGRRSLVGLQSMRSLRVGHDWATSLSLFTFMHWRRRWQPTPVFLPGESQGQRSLVGCCPWGRTESDTTEAT